ncbi:TIGR03943 family putative permease subunit [Hoyosella altamirensis]|uniref:Putative repeat protein (TIGR03943 family) n=1 Tax=Hoyosella altamirensis TaxID=616997 RepID=A0A839RS22_9ACTN|nr:TIGR03943 family protein [Hoyosella altamirensis]MBB3038916.1 putative repeat protein (TIGR03943 family) [Hoyosella altamirensis]
MTREMQNALLLLFGCVLIKIVVADMHVRYVREDFGPFLLASGVVVAGLALAGMAQDFRALRRSQHDHSIDAGRAGRAAWMLSAPVLLLLFILPPPLGPETMVSASGPAKQVSLRSAPAIAFDPLPEDSAPALSILEITRRAAFDTTGSLGGREVTVTGFWLAASESHPEPLLGRISIICCAADARLVSIRLSAINGTPLEVAADHQWFEVRGEVTPGSATERNGYIPHLRVTAARAIDPPANTYEYPGG